MNEKRPTSQTGAAGVRIRPVSSRDAERLYAFYETVAESTRAIFGHYRFTREHAAETAAANGIDSPRSHYMAVLDNGDDREEETMVGLLWFWNWTKRVPWFGIMIADAYQNRGWGKTMMEYAIAEARKHGKGGILLSTAKTNVRAQALYKRYGYETIGQDSNGEWLMLLNFPQDP